MSESPQSDVEKNRGVRILHLSVGDVVGLPLSEIAHVTPRFPNGLRNSELTKATQEIQLEVALYWFLLNFVPYDLSEGGPYFAMGHSGIGQHPFAPSRLDSKTVLKDEFNGVLPDELITNLAVNLGKNWMRKPDPTIDERLILQKNRSREESIAAILRLIDLFSKEISQLSPVHGQIGHNNPPEDIPLTPTEQQEVQKIVEEAKQNLTNPGPSNLSLVEQIWSKLKPIIDKLGHWILKQLDIFFTNLSREGGKSVGKHLPHLVLGLLGGVEVWQNHSLIEQLLTKLIQN